DHHAARAVGIDRVGAGLSPFWREIGLRRHRPKTVAWVITLREMAVAVENLDTCHNCWRSVGSNAEGVLALERRVRAPIAVRPRRTTQHRQTDRNDQLCFPKACVHVGSPLYGGGLLGVPGTSRV